MNKSQNEALAEQSHAITETRQDDYGDFLDTHRPLNSSTSSKG